MDANVIAAVVEYQRMLQAEKLARRDVCRAMESLNEADKSIRTAAHAHLQGRLAVEKALVELERALLDGSDGPHLANYAQMDWEARRNVLRTKLGLTPIEERTHVESVSQGRETHLGLHTDRRKES